MINIAQLSSFHGNLGDLLVMKGLSSLIKSIPHSFKTVPMKLEKLTRTIR